MTNAPRWRKSTRSHDQTNCVELHGTLGAVRDSKNPTGPTLSVNAAALVKAVRSGQIHA